MIIALLLALAQPTPEAAPPIVGGYGSATVDDPSVIAAANFAVRAHPNYKLKAVVTARQQVVAGMNYELCLALKWRHGSGWAQTVVYRDLKDHMRVSQWTIVDGCSG